MYGYERKGFNSIPGKGRGEWGWIGKLTTTVILRRGKEFVEFCLHFPYSVPRMVFGHRCLSFTLLDHFALSLQGFRSAVTARINTGVVTSMPFFYPTVMHSEMFVAEKVWPVVASLELSTHSDAPRFSQLSYRTTGCIFRVPSGDIFPFTDRTATCSWNNSVDDVSSLVKA